MVLTSDGALSSSSNVGTDGRASSLDGHLAGQAGSEDTGSSHCDDGCERRLVLRKN